jgi:hypothetical protein
MKMGKIDDNPVRKVDVQESIEIPRFDISPRMKRPACGLTCKRGTPRALAR